MRCVSERMRANMYFRTILAAASRVDGAYSRRFNRPICVRRPPMRMHGALPRRDASPFKRRKKRR